MYIAFFTMLGFSSLDSTVVKRKARYTFGLMLPSLPYKEHLFRNGFQKLNQYFYAGCFYESNPVKKERKGAIPVPVQTRQISITAINGRFHKLTRRLR